ncbi:MAG: 3',5'-cyclic-nucleotide phosphodiesterase [Acidobacteria bacterium]|nr:3',5'-cyclic-nucleotide phosphodiesterase [Acidobacteriota bacterium]
MKIQLLPSSFGASGAASGRQHLSCVVIDNCVALDAGSLAFATSKAQKKQIRDVVLTHAHLDHIAGLPLFIDDLFETLTEPIIVHASETAIETLKQNVFNGKIYPNFAELENKNGTVLKFHPIKNGENLVVKHLTFKAVAVNHGVASHGYIISEGATKIAVSGDTAETVEFWLNLNKEKTLRAILIECAFPDELEKLARAAHHLTPKRLRAEIKKYTGAPCPFFVFNIKPAYFQAVSRQIEALKIENLRILEVGKIYEWN